MHNRDTYWCANSYRRTRRHDEKSRLRSWHYRGMIADASRANGSNYMRVEQHSAVIHLEAISSIVLPN